MSDDLSTPHPRAWLPLRIFGWLLVIVGALLAAGGLWLISLGGSPYYILAGLVLIAAGWFYHRGRILGAWLFLGMVGLTALWSLFESGFSFWPFIARNAAPLVLGTIALFLLPLFAGGPRHITRISLIGGVAMALLTGLLLYAMTWPHGVVSHKLNVTPGHISEQSIAMGGDWRAYGRIAEGRRYAPFNQINAGNVDKLEVAWTARHGDISEVSNEDQNSPLVVNGILYHCSPSNIITAIDGTSGRILWKYDPKAKSPYWNRCRSLAYVEVPQADVCGPRLVITTIDARMIAVRAQDGQVCTAFGSNGMVDLKQGMGEVTPGMYMGTTGPMLAGNKLVVGGWVADNVGVNEPSGVIRAYNSMTGELDWAWDSGNPAILREPPAGQTYTRGSPNSWTAMSYDAGLGLVYLAMGNATPDYWGGERNPSEEQFSSSVVALDQLTGRPRWHFQTVHHDIWDYDLPSQPVLMDFPTDQGSVPALIQLTKRGDIFVLDRRNGRPLTAVEERAVPKGNAEGERYAPTQPYSVGMPRIGGEKLTEAQAWGMTPLDQMWCRIQFRRHVYEGDFTPPTTDLFLHYPGNNGGFNWGSASFDEGRNLLIVNDLRMPTSDRLLTRKEMEKHPGIDPHGIYSHMTGTPYGYYIVNFLSPFGTPCMEPPYGTISAIDMATRKLVWQRPLGTAEESGPFGLKTHLPLEVGMPTLGGTITTRGGVTFISGTQDYYLRAIDTETGRILWKGALPTGGQATPVTYLDRNGKQFIVVVAGGAPHNFHDRGDYIVAFALPDSVRRESEAMTK